MADTPFPGPAPITPGGAARFRFELQALMNEAVQNRTAFYCTLLLFSSYLFPAEAAVRVGTVWTMRRVAILVCLLPLILAVVRKIRSRRYVPVASDFFALMLLFWTPTALFMTSGIQGVASVLGVTGLEFAIPYFIGRFMLGSVSALRLCSVIILGAMIVLLGLGLLDTLTGENILARIATNIFGNFRSVKFYGTEEVQAYTTQYRFGFARARGPIEHAILYGTFFVVVAPILYYNLPGRTWKLFSLGVCAAGTIISLSSAPILAYAVFLMMVTYDHLFSRLSWRWPFLLMLVTLFLATIFIVVEDPVVAFIQGFTLDPRTGMTRLVIWHWVGQNLAVSPIFGVGAQDWFRPVDLLSSIDALWLALALQFGYVGVMIVLGCLVGAFFVMTPRKLPIWRDPAAEGPRRGATMSILLFVLASLTVYVWGASWGLFALLIGIRAGLSEAPYLPPPGHRGARAEG